MAQQRLLLKLIR